MAKTSLLELPRRTTRSDKQNEAEEASRSPIIKEESISLDDLLGRYPGRRCQVLEILQLIGPLNSAMLPLFVYGGPATGKSSVVTQVLRHLDRPFVYASCRSCYHPRILFERVLNQLSLLSKNEFSSPRSCERASDFILLLKNAITTIGDDKMIYFVFDNVETIRQWDQKSDFISLFFKLPDLLKLINVGFIFISSAGPDSYYIDTGSAEPLPVFFPNYSEDELYQIFMRNQANPKLYSSFLRVVLKPFYRLTRQLDELSIVFPPLFTKYCEQLSDQGLHPNETAGRRLFEYIQPHIAPAMEEILKISDPRSLEEKTGKALTDKESRKRRHVNVAHDGLDFHMSLSTKYLLISAFLASRNPPTLDSSMFDSTGGSGNQKRKRKCSEASRQEKEHKMQDMVMKGPGSFSLERLLAIFQCISYTADCYLEEMMHDNQMDEDEGIGSSSDVLLQLTSLCKANFISKSASCNLEGFTRYRCTVDEKVALKVARSIGFPLSKYLYRG